MSEVQPVAAVPSNVALSVHGPAGVVDMVVPQGATTLDIAREYAAQAGTPGIPLLQTPLGELVTAGRSLAELGIDSGTVLVATTGVHRPRPAAADDTLGAAAPETPRLAALAMALAAAAAVLAGWYAAHSGDDLLRTATVGVLMACALAGTLPAGRHSRQRVATAPAFGAAAAFAALYAPGDHLLASLAAVTALAAAVVAAVARALSPAPDEVLSVWITAGLGVFALGGLTTLMEWDGRVTWALLLLFSMLAARFAPSLAIDVPDEALLDLDRLAVTAWSARDTTVGRRGRVVIPRAAMVRLVGSATRTVTAACAAILVVTLAAAPLLLAAATIDLDRIGARCLVFFSGAAILLAARSYRHTAARRLLRAAGLGCWAWLLAFEATGLSATWVTALLVGALVLGAVSLAAAVATGRGWRSVWWARRAEVAEGFAGSFAFAATVVATGFFRALWELTS